MFEDADERKQRIKDYTILLLLLLLTLSALVAITHISKKTYDYFAPIQNTPLCEEKGHEAGITIATGENVCYDDCPSKEVTQCKKAKVYS